MAHVCIVLIVLLNVAVRGSAAQCEEGSEWFGSECWCSRNYYSSDGHAPCSSCENSFNTVAGSASCTCSPGYVSPSGYDPSCTKCGELSDTLGEKGWQNPSDFAYFMFQRNYPYSPFEGFASNPGHTSCTCNVGSFGFGGKSPCTQCPPNSKTVWRGHWTFEEVWYEVPAMEACKCSPGFWNINGVHPEDANPCVPCPPYAYSDSPGSPSCPLCVANAYRETAEAACQPCPVGTTAATMTTAVGLSSCAKCDIGYYSPSGSVPCTRCGDGYTTTAVGQNTCWPSAAIHTGDPTRSPTAAPTGPSAKPTPQPSVAPTIRKTSRPSAKPTMQPTHPDDCAPGFYSSTGKGPNCLRCPKGTTNEDYGQTTCPVCKDRYYGVDGKAPCKHCPYSTSSSALWDHKYCVPCVGFAPGCQKPRA
jgi:hypothetical protein